MPNFGVVPMPVSPGSSPRIRFVWAARSSSSVVQRWPPQPMYWRSSSQIKQRWGGAGASAYCVPQVVQMKGGI